MERENIYNFISVREFDSTQFQIYLNLPVTENLQGTHTKVQRDRYEDNFKVLQVRWYQSRHSFKIKNTDLYLKRLVYEVSYIIVSVRGLDLEKQDLDGLVTKDEKDNIIEEIIEEIPEFFKLLKFPDIDETILHPKSKLMVQILIESRIPMSD